MKLMLVDNLNENSRAVEVKIYSENQNINNVFLDSVFVLINDKRIYPFAQNSLARVFKTDKNKYHLFFPIKNSEKQFWDRSLYLKCKEENIKVFI